MDVRQIGPALSLFRVHNRMTHEDVARQLSGVLGKTVDADFIRLVETKEDVGRKLLDAFAKVLCVDSKNILNSAQSMTNRDEAMTELEILEDLIVQIEHDKNKEQ